MVHLNPSAGTSQTDFIPLTPQGQAYTQPSAYSAGHNDVYAPTPQWATDSQYARTLASTDNRPPAFRSRSSDNHASSWTGRKNSRDEEEVGRDYPGHDYASGTAVHGRGIPVSRHSTNEEVGWDTGARGMVVKPVQSTGIHRRTSPSMPPSPTNPNPRSLSPLQPASRDHPHRIYPDTQIVDSPTDDSHVITWNPHGSGGSEQRSPTLRSPFDDPQPPFVVGNRAAEADGAYYHTQEPTDASYHTARGSDHSRSRDTSRERDPRSLLPGAGPPGMFPSAPSYQTHAR